MQQITWHFVLEAVVKNVSTVSFARDIRPLFRSVDIEHMKPMDILLDDYNYMSDPTNAQGVYDSLTGKTEPRMPPNGPYWAKDKLELFENWMKGGFQP
jgi:hypothetical protein